MRNRPLERRARRQARRGQTLLELTLAAVIMAGTVVPGLRYMRDALDQSRDLELWNMMVTLSVSKLEENLALAADSWVEVNTSGSFSAEGYPQLLYTVSGSEATGDGGIPDRLMAIQVTVWHDSTANSLLDAGEASVLFAGKVGKLQGY